MSSALILNRGDDMMGRGVKERTRDKVAEEERNKEKREAESDIKGDLHTQTAESN